VAAEMIQMLEGLSLRGLGTVPQRIRERIDPRRTPGRRFRPPPGYIPPGAHEAGDGSGYPFGELDPTIMSIVKFGAITAAAGGVLYGVMRLYGKTWRRRRARANRVERAKTKRYLRKYKR
jgi:hypothetical protein